MIKKARTLFKVGSKLLGTIFPKRRKPLTIQLPITSKCNSRCLTCNIWKDKGRNDIDAPRLKNALSDPFFSDVVTVGINGGEFTLVPNYLDIVQALFVLPKISNIYLISNGLSPERLYYYSHATMELCSKRKICVSLCVSLDGISETHDKIRGINGNFSKVVSILDTISSNKKQYCDNLIIGHTLSKYNIDKVFEVEDFAKKYDAILDIHLAVPNKRIGTYYDAERYSVLYDDKTRQLAAEFFFSKYLSSCNFKDKARFFSNYYYLHNKGNGRLSKCDYLLQDVTIDEELNLRLCATASESLGNLKQFSASTLINSSKTKKEVRRLRTSCNQCIHYSYYPLTLRGRFLFARETVKQQYSMVLYNNLHAIEMLKTRLRATKTFFKLLVQDV